ncbi:PAS domain-containing protein [Halorubrum sp. GN11GM_10-3_MGM]|uniref:hybrid sensor histidine kinase/response regulator n=1 Tax=Halorubrum sp. GN11GM_10-3_MGM TaxID=2518111 RepID=UPI0010F86949|nr:PAS domain-containing protein [Halorubrum sp. GN11GM_10-3_MGM]TKX66090.1 PAS domain S-box protein [Halorubrum sp. GN11GM_10-3_MGM]
MTSRSDPIRVLHVDDDPEFVETAATLLEAASERITVDTATSASDGFQRLAAARVDCVVTDYEMPGQTGIEFLEAIREDRPDLPVILFTGKGSEAIASDAIAVGVTEYLQKSAVKGQYGVLANRVHNAVDSAAVESARRRHLNAIETAQEGIAILEDERFVFVNEAYADLYGYDPAELRGANWERVYPAEAVPELRTEILPTVRETGCWHGQTPGHRADGSTFPADRTISLADGGEVVCTVREITDGERHAARLERTQTRLELAIEGANLGVWDWDMRTDEVRFNDKWAEMLGYTVDELDPHLDTWEQRVHPADLDAVETALQKHMDGETSYYDTEHRMRTADEEWKWIRDIGKVVARDDAGEPVRAVGIHLDIDEQKQRERELERETQRLAEFSSVLSHDLRNPLQVASGNLELASDVCDSEYLDAATDALARIEELIDDLLRLAQSGNQVTKTDTFDLSALAENCWRHVATADATLVTETDRTLRADQSRLSQLFENLFRNSVEHGATGSRAEPGDSVEHGGTGVTITVGDLPDGFYVEDDGPGIPQADREDVFAAGYSTASEGTGFGLSIVNSVAQAHGWDVRVTDGSDGGARFEITGVDGKIS